MTHPQTCVLIGTRATVRTLAAQLALLAAPPPVVGCVLVEPVSDDDRQHPVLGSMDELAILHGRLGFTTALVSVPSTMGSVVLQVRAMLTTLGIAERVVTPLEEIVGTSSRRRIVPHANSTADMAELIGRTPHSIDRASVAGILRGKRVLVTGAGGSIGSELVRIAATFAPEQLILMERSENALFEIDRQLAQRFPSVPRRAVMHDVVDADGTMRQLAELRPHVVFHAAAHKHVPLMEDHPSHAVDNNYFGTKSMADAALAVGAERFVMISSDKAVNPTSVMGATKRLAEIYVQALHARSRHSSRRGTRFCMVRFGNVLGSACSVLPIWSQQIADGGPITVTDERMTRYFMTIYEAATLVIQAAAMSSCDAGAGVYVLDMGQPVRVLDLARRLVLSHGFEPLVRTQTTAGRAMTEGAMEIILTGSRPGEKLHEELAYAAEQLLPTDHPGINSWNGPADTAFVGGQAALETMTSDLQAVRRQGDRAAALETIRRYIPTLRRGTVNVSTPSDPLAKPKHFPNSQQIAA